MPTLKRKSSQKRKQSCKQKSKRVDKNIPKKNKRNKRLRSKRKINGGFQETYKQPGVIEKINDKIYINFIEVDLREQVPVKQIIFTGTKNIEPLFKFLYDFRIEKPPITWEDLKIGFKKTFDGISLCILDEDIRLDSTKPLYFQEGTDTKPIFFYEEIPLKQQEITDSRLCYPICPFTINLERIEYGTIHQKTLYFLIGLVLILKITIAELDPSNLRDKKNFVDKLHHNLGLFRDSIEGLIENKLNEFDIEIKPQSQINPISQF